MRKPTSLIYGVDEKPPWGISLIMGVQHICVLTIAFIFPVAIVKEIGGSPDQAQNLICMAMIATGVATILQSLNSRYIGSGYLCPMLNGPAFLSASMLAGKAGGLPLIFGMTAFGGLFEGALSRFITRMRPFFPAEVTGTVVLMVGIEVIPVAYPKLLGVDSAQPNVNNISLIVALITLATMAGINVWGKGKSRLFSVLFGMVIGYLAAWLAGIFGRTQLQPMFDAPVVRVPAFAAYGLAFDATLAIPFMVASLCSVLKTVGDLTMTQKINDSAWKRPDMKSIGNGVLACSIGNLLSGIAGALGQSPSSSNIGLSVATGATSRRIAYAIGGILIVLAFFPKLASIFVIMPQPVMGALLIFAACFMIMAGFQIVTSRALDARKIFVIGLSIIFGLGLDLIPKPVVFPPWLAPITTSSLALATVSAVLLNIVMRIGIKKKVVFKTSPAEYATDKLFAFMETNSAAWGARKEVIDRATMAMDEFMEALATLQRKEEVTFTVIFDEFSLNVVIGLAGASVQFPGDRPDPTQMMDEHAAAQLALYLMSKYADKVKSQTTAEGQSISLYFEH